MIQQISDRAGERRPPTTTIEAEGREAVREIVAASGSVGFISRAEFGRDGRFVPLEIVGADMLMDEALICLKERTGAKLVNAFLKIARSEDLVKHR